MMTAPGESLFDKIVKKYTIRSVQRLQAPKGVGPSASLMPKYTIPAQADLSRVSQAEIDPIGLGARRTRLCRVVDRSSKVGLGRSRNR
jgi:hypothetical protein